MGEHKNQPPCATIGPLKLSRLNLCQALDRLDEMVRDGKRHTINFCEANLFVHACKDPQVADVLNRSGMTLADGTVLVLLSRLLGNALPQRVPGPSFMLAACQAGVEKGYRHFFYGGEAGVADDLARRMQERYPGLIVAGSYSPPFGPTSEAEEVHIRKMLTDAKIDLLWVGLGGPKQAFWMAHQIESIDVPVMLGVGAAFDFHSGRVPWAPAWIRKIGMEWAFRAVTGGRRVFLRNLWCVPMSAFVALREIFKVHSAARIKPQ